MKRSICCNAFVEIIQLPYKLGDADGNGDENKCICKSCGCECETYESTVDDFAVTYTKGGKSTKKQPAKKTK